MSDHRKCCDPDGCSYALSCLAERACVARRVRAEQGQAAFAFIAVVLVVLLGIGIAGSASSSDSLDPIRRVFGAKTVQQESRP